MKFAVTLCCLAVVVAVAAADAGQFIPKAFYTMDSEGHKSDVHPISPHTANYLRRMRRQTYTVQSISTSSSDGGPLKFTNSETVVDPQVLTRSGGGVQPKGHIVTTTGEIDKSGKVTYKTQEGYFEP